MVPPASSTARRPSPRIAPRPATPRRPPLRIFEPLPRSRRSAGNRTTVLAAGALVVGSLLAVVVADDMVAQDQVRLANAQRQIVAATTDHNQLQVSVAERSAPPVVVTQAEHQLGMVTVSKVVDLPYVPLGVVLPEPQTGTTLTGAQSHSSATTGTTAAGASSKP